MRRNFVRDHVIEDAGWTHEVCVIGTDRVRSRCGKLVRQSRKLDQFVVGFAFPVPSSTERRSPRSSVYAQAPVDTVSVAAHCPSCWWVLGAPVWTVASSSSALPRPGARCRRIVRTAT